MESASPFVVTAAQMRAAEEAAVAAGSDWAVLMERAGTGVAEAALAHFAPLAGRTVLALVGPGNNGGDALVAARHLADAGAQVTLYCWRRNRVDDNLLACRARGIREVHAADDADGALLRAMLAEATLVIDGLLGTGARPPADDLAAIIAAANTARAQRADLRVVAIDLPSGVAADDGQVATVAIRADLTVATGLLKRGLLLWPGRGYAGTIVVAPIGLGSLDEALTMSELLTATQARAFLPARPADAHKGVFGKVLVLAGSINYPGAAALACAGAQRSGAGLVTLATGRNVLALAKVPPEVTLLPVAEGDWGAIGPAAVDELADDLPRYQALLIGPGLGQAEATRQLVLRLFGLDQVRSRARVGFVAVGDAIAHVPQKTVELPPTVIDADGLNLLASASGWFERLSPERCVLTPHPGEMRRLLGVTELPPDAVAVATEAAQRWRQTVVLKGATTVIAAPDGHTLIHDGANPALATAGSGDVLAGIIAGLMAQGCAPFAAAALGVYLHGAAGAKARAAMGDAGVVAGDLLPLVPQAIRELRAG
ncbi:bifunctional ADP-dependent (S)-NAD(P)H-hydrate dehydratase/NAD(P)H-hydrate epimerase [Chloroflexus islandicus]|uniref:Bifunctional NAD(P)H-hydrate repair enzyme n=1 Tax=Chloroflexus islandicus TaxID=1707952 RepID=A0A178M9V7_9CHLR|nr:bifunctional ADP-dependent NAD(P)H-hydrate dehydratase/NAD(P)H-hydrate epimerase [Chloroflexus islandicus]OAN44987.1 bifunctional ADP-dependent (S)-NAD(P)H-hydrate dehydratase/NAD(P)H-hydrate epimerase [Chloroflexus islandicus]